MLRNHVWDRMTSSPTLSSPTCSRVFLDRVAYKHCNNTESHIHNETGGIWSSAAAGLDRVSFVSPSLHERIGHLADSSRFLWFALQPRPELSTAFTSTQDGTSTIQRSVQSRRAGSRNPRTTTSKFLRQRCGTRRTQQAGKEGTQMGKQTESRCATESAREAARTPTSSEWSQHGWCKFKLQLRRGARGDGRRRR